MLNAFLASLEQSQLAAALSGSVYAYPLANAAHIVGIALLFGAIVPLDLRLMGVRRTVGVEDASRLLLPVAISGLILAVCAGSLLFITDARDYASSTLFRIKLIVISLATINALALRWRSHTAHQVSRVAPARLAAAASIALWFAAIVLGRLVGYF